MTSNRYPQGLQNAHWYPLTLTVKTGTTRDVYGQVTATTSVTTKGKITYREVELIEGGTRVKRAGAKIELSDRKDMTVDIGTIVSDGTNEYTIIGYRAGVDYQGNTHFWICDAVKKATDQ